MDKRARELARRVGAGEVLAEDADAALIRQGAFSDSAVELAALAGNVAAQAVCPLPEFETLEDWLLEFNRFGQQARALVCSALAETTLRAWRGGRCTCGHLDYLHEPLFAGCVRCECGAPDLDCGPHRALEAIQDWLGEPSPERARAARQAGEECVAELPSVAFAAFSLQGPPTFDWIKTVLKVSPFATKSALQARIQALLGDLEQAEALAQESSPAPRAPEFNPRNPFVCFYESDMEDAAAVARAAEARDSLHGLSWFLCDLEEKRTDFVHRSDTLSEDHWWPELFGDSASWSRATPEGIHELAIKGTWLFPRDDVEAFVHATFDPPHADHSRALALVSAARDLLGAQLQAIALRGRAQDPRALRAAFLDGLGQPVPQGLISMASYSYWDRIEGLELDEVLDDMF